MPQCLVVADDLTGANATGVLLTRLNLKTLTLMNEERLTLNNLEQCDCVVYPTDSRSIDPQMAYNRVYNVTGMLKAPEIQLYSKRIDSTLRGNLGSETDAMLDALGDDYIAVVVPCFPQAGRVTVGGYLLVNGKPLHKTEANLDPKNPITTSSVEALFKAQTKYQTAPLSVEDLAAGPRHMTQRILALHGQGARIFLCDALSGEDMELIAEAVIATGLPFAAVDPGSFTATVARKLLAPSAKQTGHKILVAVGSVNAVAKAQVEKLFLTQKVHNVYINIGEILEGDARRQEEIRRVSREILDNCADYEVCSIVGAGIQPENRVSFEPYIQRYQCDADALSQMVNEGIAEITYNIITAGKGFGGVYTCGGDISVSVCKRFGTFGLRLADEVVPLAAYGELIGGSFTGMKMITKGGMVGDEDALVTCVRYMKEKLSVSKS